MNRTTFAVLVAAALVGTVGGSVTAVVRDSASPTGLPSSSSTPTADPGESSSASPTSTPPGPREHSGTVPLLYAGGQVIHDGTKRVRYDAPVDTPERLVRLPIGYLIAYPVEAKEPDRGLRLSAVAPDGRTSTVAEVLGAFDLDGKRDRVVGVDRNSGRLTVWDLRGRVQAQAPKQRANRLEPVLHDNTVLFSGRIVIGGSGRWLVWAWDLRSGAVRQTDDEGMVRWEGSPDGSLVVGDVGVDGIAGDDVEANACTQVISAPGATRVSWRSCDWRRFGSRQTFSPDGTRLLTIAADTPYGGEADYGGATYAIFSATKGPSSDLTRIVAPEATVTAQWRSADRLIFITTRAKSPDEADNGTVLTECTFDGRCREVARRDKGLLVVGEQ